VGRKTRNRRAKSAPVTYTLRSTPNWPLLALSILGMLLTAYLTWAKFSSSALQGCAVGGGCDLVLTSRWATLLGVPTSLWGFLGYAALAAIAFVRREDQQRSWAWTVAVFGVCYSVYLTIVSLTVLHSACPYCLTSLTLMSAILALVLVQGPFAVARRSWLGLAGRVAVAAVVILAAHAVYTAPQEEPTGPEDPKIRALAEHLKDKGVLFYGASWCPHCQEQKRLFGASARRLPYVECNLAGPNAPQASACTQAGVDTYPTWFINGRRYAVGQVLTLAELANATGFPDAAAFKTQ
jgi:uncharacterized membrane protein/glutaredoxin